MRSDGAISGEIAADSAGKTQPVVGDGVAGWAESPSIYPQNRRQQENFPFGACNFLIISPE